MAESKGITRIHQTRLRAAGAVLALAISVAAIGLSLGAVPKSSAAGDRGVLHLVATLDAHNVIRKRDPGGEALARYYVTLPGAKERVGRIYEDCTDTWDNQEMCTWSIALYARIGVSWSQITMGGLVSLYERSHLVPIQGGTGKYAGVTGQALWKFVSPKIANLSLTIGR